MQMQCNAPRCAVPEAWVVVVVVMVMVMVMQTLAAYFCVMDTDTDTYPVQHRYTDAPYTAYYLHYATHLPPNPHLNKPQRNSQSRVHACVPAWAV
jgi:hypothetical protein